MQSRRSNRLKIITDIVFMIYVISIYIFSFKAEFNTISNSVFALFVLLTLVLIIGQHKIILNKEYIILGAFITYSFISILWSINSDTSVSVNITLLTMGIMSFMVYQVFKIENSIDFILKSLMIAGLVMSMYTILYYGPSNFFTALLTGLRLGTEINQANVMGMYAGMTSILCVYYALIKNKKYLYLVTILPFLTCLSSGSRTGLAVCVFGIVLLVMLKNGTRKLYKGIFVALLVGIALYSLLQLPIFDEATKRVDTLLNVFSNDGKVDSSTIARLFMIDFGIEKFQQNPIFGYGADSSRILLAPVFTKTYLHNNFVELLVDYGLVGFLLYYSLYMVIFLKIVPGLKANNSEAIIITILLFMQLISDYGSVTYYRKTTYILLTAGFIVANYRTYYKSKNRNQIKEY